MTVKVFIDEQGLGTLASGPGSRLLISQGPFTDGQLLGA